VHGFEKRFWVGAIDRGLVRTSAWKFRVPRPGTKDPLVITFPKPLDHALVLRMLRVHHASNNAGLNGGLDTEAGEREWWFTPDFAWRDGDYYVSVDTELEDLAGNNLRRSFDVMPGDSAARGVSAPTTRVPFTVRLR
jgi:hypothetical protein